MTLKDGTPVTVWCTGCGQAAHDLARDAAAAFIDSHDCGRGITCAKPNTQ